MPRPPHRPADHDGALADGATAGPGRRPGRWWRRALSLLAAAGAVVALASCAGGGGDEPTSVGVGMLDNVYTRDVTRIEVGDTVRFSNDGDTVHNAVAADGSWSTEQATDDLAMQPGEDANVVIDEPGLYTFYCTFHATQDADGDWQGMVATLAVGDVALAEDRARAPDPVTEWSGTVRDVPRDHPTIQNAVDAADPGDLVLVQPGVYREQVDVTTPSITIRGTDRQEVIVDGEFTRPNAINVAAADGVAIENLTVRNATVNGLFFTTLTGYRASHVTARNNGVYGIYAFDATDGVFEHSYAAGSPDAGFYIGQCDPCDGIIDDVVAEWNGLGYSGTNASGVTIVDSTWRHNIAGIVPNTLDTELLPPFADVTIAGNLVHDNDNLQAPALSGAWGSFGTGITLAGGNDSTVVRNRVVNHQRAGIFVTPNISRRFWMSGGNRVTDNVVDGSGLADITLSGIAMAGNCFSGNEVATTTPPGLQALYGCGGLRAPMRYEVGQMMVSLGRVTEAGDAAADRVDAWRTAPTPAADDQPDLPGGADAPVVPAHDVTARHDLDLATVALPDLPDSVEVTRSKVMTMSGIPLLANGFTIAYGLYAFLLPFALYAAWIGLAAWDLARRDDLSRAATVGWLAVALVVPFVGPILYFVLGHSRIPSHVRWTLVAGGMGAYVLTFVVGALVGGVV